jgi:hypothetical protein
MMAENAMCDVCGIDKKKANHWFMAFEDKGVLRLSPWSGLNPKRLSMKHLCGQACVHRLVDVFLAGHSVNELTPDVFSKAAANAPNDQIDNRESEVPVN